MILSRDGLALAASAALTREGPGGGRTTSASFPTPR